MRQTADREKKEEVELASSMSKVEAEVRGSWAGWRGRGAGARLGREAVCQRRWKGGDTGEDRPPSPSLSHTALYRLPVPPPPYRPRSSTTPTRRPPRRTARRRWASGCGAARRGTTTTRCTDGTTTRTHVGAAGWLVIGGRGWLCWARLPDYPSGRRLPARRLLSLRTLLADPCSDVLRRRSGGVDGCAAAAARGAV